jgi:signal transduction histidine kinase
VVPAPHTEAERTVALARVALAVTSWFAIWLDPAEPARYAQLTYSLHAVYVVYAASLGLLVWARRGGASLPLLSHVVDICAFSVFQFLTLGPSSPFFVYFVFSLFCAAIRWGWRATLWTAAVVVVAYLAITVSMMRRVGPQEFELNRAIIRTMYLLVSAALLVYLGRYEQRLRADMERLARWPAATGADIVAVTDGVIRHAAEIVGARRALVMWEAGEEPGVNVATWSPSRGTVLKRSPGQVQDLLPQELERATFISSGAIDGDAPVRVSTAGAPSAGLAFLPSPLLAPLEGAIGLSSAPFSTERVSGRAFFADIAAPGAEMVPLTDVVAREIGNSLEQLQVTLQLRDIAASEERLRVARDLHDGVLQSLTGIRLEIRSLASAVASDPAPGRARLLALERALAIEQRELRQFIEALAPSRSRREPQAVDMRERLESLRERMALEWKTPVTLRVGRDMADLPEPLVEAVRLMVHEAIVNALKHGDPSRVAVTVERPDGDLRIGVADDGHGFPFHGRYDHAALERLSAAPRSLLERVSALGGELAIESSDSGSRVEIVLKAQGESGELVNGGTGE